MPSAACSSPFSSALRSAWRTGWSPYGAPSPAPSWPLLSRARESRWSSSRPSPTGSWRWRKRRRPDHDMAADAREVVVVGAGPAGTAAAILLRQRGHDVLLIDEARFPREKVCGESVSPEAWRLLRSMDAEESVRALAPRAIHGM